ncbi:hypothetical protein Tco_0783425 [Tanacetum coccineum]
MNLLKEDVANVLVCVKLHGVPVMAFIEDGLSAIATKLGTPLMLDSYTSDMCMQSWGRSSYVRAMIKLWADVELKDTIMDKYPKNISSGVAKNLKNPSQAPRGVLVGHKVGFKPVKQIYRPISKKKNANTSGNKKKDVKSRKEVIIHTHLMLQRGLAMVLIVFWNNGGTYENADYDYDPYDDDIHFVYLPFKEVGCLCNGQRKLVIVGDDGKPLKSCKSMLPSSFNVASKKVDDPVKEDSDDEVLEVYNETATFMASTNEASKSGSGGGQKSLYEQ